jgi:Flp pilus assembly protein TadG
VGAFFTILFAKARAFRSTGGATAVEFALVFPILLLVSMVWLELGLTLWMQQTLDNSTRKAARLIRTGQVPTQAQFNAAVCAGATVLSCANVQSRVQSGTSFAALSPTVTMTATGGMSNTSYSLGGSGSDVLAQAGYTHQIVTPLVGNLLGNNGYVLLVSTVAFQNEPD